MLPTVALLSLAAVANAHIGAWSQKGMFCKGGNNSAVDDQNTNLVVNPLYMLPKNKWWMQADRGCDKVPPTDVMELKAGGTLEVELATNRAFTSLSYGGKYMSDWDDGAQHPEDWHAPGPGKCLGDNPDGKGGELHTTGQDDAAGTAFAISYADKLEDVTMENLVVFTTKFHTPWKKNTTYDIPADLPANCPNGRCYCAWLWIPNGCGQPNMYMQNFYCNVVGSTSTKKLAPAQPPKWCADDQTKCVKGAKQMLAWNQAEGNNVVVPNGKSPAYNGVMGWAEGAQNDIFVDGPATSASTTASATSTAAPTTLSTQTKPATTTTSVASSAPASSASQPVTTTKASATTTKASATTITTSIRPSTTIATSIRPPASSPPATTSANATTSTAAPTQPAGSCGNHGNHGSHGGY